MFDRRQNAFVTYNAFLFDATFTDGFSVEIQVNPEFQTRQAAQQEADKYSRLIGQLPRALRQPELQPVWIHKGDELFGGRNNNVLIHTDYADGLEAQGLLVLDPRRLGLRATAHAGRVPPRLDAV